MPLSETIGELVVSTEAEERLLEWRIPEFMSLRSESYSYYLSPLFRMDGVSWCFHLCPNWTDVRSYVTSGCVRLGLQRRDAGPPLTFRVSLSIKGFPAITRERKIQFSACGSICWIDFCSRSDLMDSSILIPGGVLTITCVIKRKNAATAVPAEKEKNAVEEDESGKESNDEKKVKQQNQVENYIKRIEKLAEDFGKLLSSGENSDVTVQVGDVEFKVHSQVLFARSPALSASLQHECREKATNRIIVEDCEPEVFEEFLEFIYKGSVRSLTDQNVFDLYRIADKYLVDDLKQQCLEHVRDTLSVQTFCQALGLALTYEKTELLEQAVHFATKNVRLIIRSVEWQEFMCEHPTEANEILIKSLGPPR